MSEKVESGIPRLDSLMKIPREANILVIGEERSGSSTILKQFLHEGLKRGESGIYVAIDEPPQKVRDSMRDFRWDLSTYEGRTFEFVDCYTSWLSRLGILRPSERENFTVSNDRSPEEIYETILSARRKVGRGRVVFDSISGLLTRVSIEAGLEPTLCAIMERNYRRLAIGVTYAWSDPETGAPRVLVVDPTVVSEDIIGFLESRTDFVIRLLMAERRGRLARQIRLERWEMREGRRTPVEMTDWEYFEITDRGVAILG